MKRKPKVYDRVFAQYIAGAEEMSVSYYPDRAGFSMIVTNNWCDGKYRPLTRAWRTKVLHQLGFKVLRWKKTDWGEQAEFAPTRAK